MTFPETPLPIKVELFYDDDWHDITTDDNGDTRIYRRDAITITRGRPDQAANVAPAQCNLTINNRDGLFSPRNPSSPLYGKIGKNSPLRVSVVPDEAMPGPLFDASSSASGTGDLSWTHTPVGRPRGVLVVVFQATGVTDEVNSVTYGGVAMAETDDSPLVGDAGTEDGVVYAYFLGAGIPAGPQTVQVDVNGTASSKHAVVVSLTALSDTEFLLDGTTNSASTANPSSSLSAAQTDRATFVLGALLSSHDATSSVAPGAGMTQVGEHDLGSMVTSVIYRTANIGPAGGTALAWTATAASVYSLRVYVRETDMIRFTGEVASWPVEWDTTGTDVWSQITVNGVTRRLGQGAAVPSATYRDYLAGTNPRRYWPLDDPEGSANGVQLNPANRRAVFKNHYGTFEYGKGDLGSPLLAPGLNFVTSVHPAFGNIGYVYGDPAVGASSAIAVDFVFRKVGQGVFAMETTNYGTGSGSLSYSLAFRADGTNWDIQLTLTQGSDDPMLGPSVTLLEDTAILTELQDERPHHVRFTLTESGGDLLHDTFLDGASVDSGSVVGIADLGGLSRVKFRHTPSGGASPLALGHVAVWVDTVNFPDLDDVLLALRGYAAEPAAERLLRLGADLGMTILGDAGATEVMGAQGSGDRLQQLQECASADDGILYESRTGLGLVYRTRADMYTQVPALELDYTDGVFSQAPAPDDDDRYTRNDVTVSRTGGGSVRAVLESGPMSTQPPPEGVGEYATQQTVNVGSDDRLPGQAWWRLHLGTVDEARYPRLPLNLARNVDLLQQVANVELGDKVRLVSMPPWLPPDDVDQLVQGYRERLANFEWDIELITAPASPFEAAVYGDTQGDGDRYDSSGSELAAGVDAAATQLVVTDTGGTGNYTWWTTDPDAFPLDIHIGGERITVTDIEGEPPQMVGVGAAVSNANAAGTSTLTPNLPAGVQPGDVVFIFASIRNSGAGTVDTPANWAALVAGNCKLLKRTYDGVWTMPTLTFTGGVANATLLAQSCAWRGIATDYWLLASALNGAGQNVAWSEPSAVYADVTMYLGWKQDDWTSVAEIPGTTEIQEADTTSGDDAGQVWAYAIPRLPQDADEFVVTGGASAISRGIIVKLLRGPQTFTVVRAVNGVPKSHEAAAPVRLWKTPRYGL